MFYDGPAQHRLCAVWAATAVHRFLVENCPYISMRKGANINSTTCVLTLKETSAVMSLIRTFYIISTPLQQIGCKSPCTESLRVLPPPSLLQGPIWALPWPAGSSSIHRTNMQRHCKLYSCLQCNTNHLDQSIQPRQRLKHTVDNFCLAEMIQQHGQLMCWCNSGVITVSQWPETISRLWWWKLETNGKLPNLTQQLLFFNNSPLSLREVIQTDVTVLCSQFLLYSLRSNRVSSSYLSSVLLCFSFILANLFLIYISFNVFLKCANFIPWL